MCTSERTAGMHEQGAQANQWQSAAISKSPFLAAVMCLVLLGCMQILPNHQHAATPIPYPVVLGPLHNVFNGKPLTHDVLSGRVVAAGGLAHLAILHAAEVIAGHNLVQHTVPVGVNNRQGHRAVSNTSWSQIMQPPCTSSLRMLQTQ